MTEQRRKLRADAHAGRKGPRSPRSTCSGCPGLQRTIDCVHVERRDGRRIEKPVFGCLKRLEKRFDHSLNDAGRRGRAHGDGCRAVVGGIATVSQALARTAPFVPCIGGNCHRSGQPGLLPRSAFAGQAHTNSSTPVTKKNQFAATSDSATTSNAAEEYNGCRIKR